MAAKPAHKLLPAVEEKYAAQDDAKDEMSGRIIGMKKRFQEIHMASLIRERSISADNF